MWLKAQQLLNQLLGEKQIKVKCRKATNDNHISSYAYSWEESNKWSGGEKWSKNMALFLGCLNYLAEKRKQAEKEIKTAFFREHDPVALERLNEYQHIDLFELV